MNDKTIMMANWRNAFALYSKPIVLGMAALGFAAGIPYQLVFFTLALRLREAGIDHATIGFLSWLGITYALKIFFSLLVDHVRIPLITHQLGKRRSWILLSQISIALGLFGMGYADPVTQLTQLIFLGIAVICSSAIQDVTIDAYRIEAIANEYQGAMSAAYVTGYRIALLITGVGTLYIAEYANWRIAYWIMAAMMLIGVITTLLVQEPNHAASPVHCQFKNNFEIILITPFLEFFQRYGQWGIVILIFIGIYKMSDITLGSMASAFYLDLGFSKAQIANVTKLFSFFASIIGVTLGGAFVARYGVNNPLTWGAAMMSFTNLLFALLAITKPSLAGLAIVVSADSFFGGMATAIFIAYLSGLTSPSHTATQYALFSSLMTLPSQSIGGFSGIIVEQFGYSIFFIYSALIGLPALFLAIFLSHQKNLSANQL